MNLVDAADPANIPGQSHDAAVAYLAESTTAEVFERGLHAGSSYFGEPEQDTTCRLCARFHRGCEPCLNMILGARFRRRALRVLVPMINMLSIPLAFLMDLFELFLELIGGYDRVRARRCSFVSRHLCSFDLYGPHWKDWHWYRFNYASPLSLTFDDLRLAVFVGGSTTTTNSTDSVAIFGYPTL